MVLPFGANSNRMGIEDIDGGSPTRWPSGTRDWRCMTTCAAGIPSSTGQGEFYLEYGSFDVSLTVPADMLVAATGMLRIQTKC